MGQGQRREREEKISQRRKGRKDGREHNGKESLATFAAWRGKKNSNEDSIAPFDLWIATYGDKIALFLPTLTQSDGLAFPSVPSDLSQRVSALPLFSIQAVKPLNQQITCDEEPFS